MNKPPLLSLNNHVIVGKNPPGKHTDKGGNAGISNIEENGIQVQLTFNDK